MTLRGTRVLVTRAVEDAPEFEELLRARGAVPVRMPCIATAPTVLKAASSKETSESFGIGAISKLGTQAISACVA